MMDENKSYTFQERTDKLALLYLEKTCDISSMSVEEYVKKFNEISEELIKFCMKK